jgi:hypothetical protein
MENVSSADGLKYAIQLLEVEQVEKLQLLKEQSHLIAEILKPANLLRSALKDIVLSPHLLEDMVDTGVGLATGFFSKKIFIGSSVNLFRKLFGSVLQVGITTIVTQNSEFIKSFGQFLFQRISVKNRLNSKNSG